jgi:YtcA family
MQSDYAVPGAGIAYRESLLVCRLINKLNTGARLAALTLAALLFAGCDPVINIAGANFPAWLVCAIAGVVLATVARTMFAAARVEPHLGPLTLVYPCLAVLLSCVVWMIFFNRI